MMAKLEKFATRPKSVAVVLHSDDAPVPENHKQVTAFLPKNLS